MEKTKLMDRTDSRELPWALAEVGQKVFVLAEVGQRLSKYAIVNINVEWLR